MLSLQWPVESIIRCSAFREKFVCLFVVVVVVVVAAVVVTLWLRNPMTFCVAMVLLLLLLLFLVLLVLVFGSGRRC